MDIVKDKKKEVIIKDKITMGWWKIRDIETGRISKYKYKLSPQLEKEFLKSGAEIITKITDTIQPLAGIIDAAKDTPLLPFLLGFIAIGTESGDEKKTTKN